MRRSRSHLKNLNAQAPGGMQMHDENHPPSGAHSYADEIQRRIDSLGGNHFQNAQMAYGYPATGYPQPQGAQPWQQALAAPHFQQAPHHPAYAGFPHYPHAHQPAPSADAAGEVRAALAEMSNRLKAMQDDGAGQAAREQENAALAGTVHTLASEMAALKNAVASSLAAQPAAKDIEGIREAVEAARSDLVRASASGSSIDPEAYARVVEASHEKLTHQMREIQEALVSKAGDSGSVEQSLEKSHEALRKQIGDLQQSLSAGWQEQAANSQAGLELQQQIVEKLEYLGTAVSRSAGAGAAPVEIEAIEARLEEITRAIVALSHNNGNLDQLERLEARISDLAGGIEARLHEGSADGSGLILARLEELAQAYAAGGIAAGSGEAFGELSAKVSSIEEQLAASRDISIEMASQVAEEAVQRVINQIDLSNTSGAGIDPELLTTLSVDIKRLQESTSETNSDVARTFESMRETLGALVDRLDHLETADVPDAPDAGTVLAEPVADIAPDAAVPDAEPAEPSGEPEEVAQAPAYEDQNRIDEFRALANRQSEEPVRKPGIAQSLVEEARRAERERLQSRQAEPEADLPDPARMTPEVGDLPPSVPHAGEVRNDLPVHEAPGVVPEVSGHDDIEFDETPLEPGSGGPDLAALVKQANERRKSMAKNGEGTAGTDFIAAARRAAQAAAQEASAAHEEVREQEKSSGGSLLGGLPGLFSRRKKVVTTAAAAILLAAIALPFAGSYLLPKSGFQLASEVSERMDQKIASEENLVNETEVTGAISEPQSARVVEAELAQAETIDEQAELSPEPAESAELEQQTPETDPETAGLAEALPFGNDALKAAVAAGNPAAFHEVARRFTEGLGTGKDLKQAAVWYERAAERDHAPSQYMIGNFSEKGVGIERDISLAANWYERAADNGNVISMHNLAVLHATPNAISAQPDMNTAFQWFRKAAEHGVRDSQVNLGIFHTKGVGTKTDLPEAYKWFTIAAKAGDSDAEAKRDVIAEALRPDQLEDAKTRVENWRPEEYHAAANTAEPDPAWLDAASQQPLALSKETVLKTQQLLARIGYDAGPADGILGSKTKDAIAQFQQRVGLAINGEISAELLRELEAVAI